MTAVSTRKTFGSQQCSIARTLDVVGDWWTLLVLRDVFLGKRRFDDLKTSLAIATNVLTARLKRLTDAGILERRAYQEHPARFEYPLTDKGRDLYPVLIALLQWGDRHMRDGAGDAPPRVLVHEACGNPTHATLTCPHCRSEITARNTRTVARGELGVTAKPTARATRVQARALRASPASPSSRSRS
jgi:DNA-binding HxlR family transcriptional regulator